MPRLLNVLPSILRRHKVIECLIRIFPFERVATFSFNGSAIITADLADAAARQTLITRSFEPDFFSIANAFLLPGTAFYDIGANHGFCSFGLIAERGAESGIEYHLFEANRNLYETLQLACRNYSGCPIFANHACVSDEGGTSKLHVVPHQWGESFITKGTEEGDEVTNIVIDEYMQRSAGKVASFVKVDVEGFEPYVLRGMERSIRDGKIGAMLVECSAITLARQGYDASSLVELLKQLGFRCFWCKEQDLLSNSGDVVNLLPREGAKPVRLAPLRAISRDHETDILAIAENGPYAHLLEQVGD